MADKDTRKAGKQRAARGSRKAGGAKPSTGRLQVRADAAEYRAAAQDQAARVRGEIDAALKEAQRTRAEIEARMDRQ